MSTGTLMAESGTSAQKAALQTHQVKGRSLTNYFKFTRMRAERILGTGIDEW